MNDNRTGDIRYPTSTPGDSGFPLTPVPVDPQVLAADAGRYQFDDFNVIIRVDGTRIFILMHDRIGHLLRALSYL